MKNIRIYNDYEIVRLSKSVALEHISVITELANMIPLVEYTNDMILAESKEGIELFGKWDHSMIVLKKGLPIAILIAYERLNDEYYPKNSLYISELVVHNRYRRLGIASVLLETFLCIRCFNHLSGNLGFSVQTNSALWNQYVIDMYKGFGFQEVGFKDYWNRKDVILFIN